MIAGESPAAVEAMAMNLIGTVTVSRIGRPVTGLSVVAELQNCSSAMSIFGERGRLLKCSPAMSE